MHIHGIRCSTHQAFLRPLEGQPKQRGITVKKIKNLLKSKKFLAIAGTIVAATIATAVVVKRKNADEIEEIDSVPFDVEG